MIAALAALIITPMSATAQQEWSPEDANLCCTSIMVAKNASTDGSVITSHTCDGSYRTWMQMVPASDHKDGEMENIYGGRMHTMSATDSTKMTVKGQIPQVKHTYRFLDTASRRPSSPNGRAVSVLVEVANTGDTPTNTRTHYNQNPHDCLQFFIAQFNSPPFHLNKIALQSAH